jgi:hypothetical protein
MLPDIAKNTVSQDFSVVRLEFSGERHAKPCSHPAGGLKIVFEGKWHCHMNGCAVSLRAGDILRVAIQVKSHDIVAPVNDSPLSFSIDGPCRVLVPADDPDQYLWGV